MIYRILGIILVATIASLLLKGIGSRIAPLVAVLVIIMSYSLVIDFVKNGLADVFSAISFEGADEAIRAVLKVVGVGYLFGICESSCRALGENDMAGAIEMIGHIEIFTMICPYVIGMLKAVVGLIG